MSIKSDPDFFTNFAMMNKCLKQAELSMQRLGVIAATVNYNGIEVLMREEEFFDLFGDIATPPSPGTEGFMFSKAKAFDMTFTAFFKQESQS